MVTDVRKDEKILVFAQYDTKGSVKLRDIPPGERDGKIIVTFTRIPISPN